MCSGRVISHVLTESDYLYGQIISGTKSSSLKCCTCRPVLELIGASERIGDLPFIAFLRGFSLRIQFLSPCRYLVRN